jgi:hypothetical protein
MKSTHSLLAGFLLLLGSLLTGCASVIPSGSNGLTTVTYKGPPTIVVTMPDHLRESDLVNGIPPIRISGPSDIEAALILFDDKDGNGDLTAGEFSMRFRALPDQGRLGVAGVRLTRMQAQSLGKRRMFGVEVREPSSGHRYFTAHSID